MNKSLLLGLSRYLLPVPRPLWQREVDQRARSNQDSLAFMSPDHHRVRNFVVVELPRLGRPILPAWIAERLNLPLESVQRILVELEEHKSFLFRNLQGEVAWAYPVTTDQTPHRVTFSSGEQIYAA
jgi:hypothetical protein